MRLAIAGAAILAMLGAAQASTYSVAATDNATVQPGGPRAGTNGKRFLNIEGDANGAFASYGVIEIEMVSLNLTSVTDISNVKLSFTHAPAAFSVSGPFNIYVTEDNTTTIQPGTPPAVPIYDGTNVPEGLGTQFAPNYLIGSGMYDSTVLPNLPMEYTIDINSAPAAAKTYIINQINARGRIRFIITATSGFTAATYAGYTYTLPDTSSGAPKFTFDTDAQQIITPTSATIQPGSAVSGALADIYTSNNAYFVMRPGAVLVATADPLRVVLEGTAPGVAPAAMSIKLESKANATVIRQTVEAFNFATNAYVQMAQALITTSDQTLTLALTTPADFVGPNREVRVRLSYKAMGAVLVYPWFTSIDEATWRYTP